VIRGKSPSEKTANEAISQAYILRTQVSSTTAIKEQADFSKPKELVLFAKFADGRKQACFLFVL
jgi:hypothetical protein